jgi:F0F1-type ATP synthase membrane subunit b/b'
MKLPAIFKTGVLTCVGLVLATSSLMADYQVQALYGRSGSGGKPDRVRMYDTAEVNSLVAASADASLRATNSAVAAAKAEMKTEITSVQTNVQKQVAEALTKIPATLFSEEAKGRLSSQIAEEVAAQTKAELDRFKADFKAELLQAMDAKLAGRKQPR